MLSNFPNNSFEVRQAGYSLFEIVVVVVALVVGAEVTIHVVAQPHLDLDQEDLPGIECVVHVGAQRPVHLAVDLGVLAQLPARGRVFGVGRRLAGLDLADVGLPPARGQQVGPDLVLEAGATCSVRCRRCWPWGPPARRGWSG